MCWCDRPDCDRDLATFTPRCFECGSEEHRATMCGGACRRLMCPQTKHVRFYCPNCHEVHCGQKRMGEWIVTPHYRVDVDIFLLDDNQRRMAGKPCRGGPVNFETDRAP